ncbi:CpaF family protein [Antrihabitans spumae]|uniref:CpaF family protein n=1 Tax=Antrihabitans spumae TaxID=3373370 RepID=A0ABW7KCV5_9NOCA
MTDDNARRPARNPHPDDTEPAPRRDLTSFLYRGRPDDDLRDNGYAVAGFPETATRPAQALADPGLPPDPWLQPATPAAELVTSAKPGPKHRAPLDKGLIRSLSSEASKRLTEQRRDRDSAVADPNNITITIGYSAEEIEELGTLIVEDLVREHVSTTIDVGGGVAPMPDEEQALVRAICDTLFRLGPVQPLVDEPDIENILITNGHTTVMYGDGRIEVRDPVFDSEEEAIHWVSFLGAHAPGGGRSFSQANPAMRLNLKGNIRLSAIGWASAGLSIAIRKHLHKDITIDKLVQLGVMPEELAELLVAAVLAGTSVMVSGPMGVGKTTLVRALANALPLETRIGTAELVRELYLHELPGREPFVVSSEVITGGGERNEFTDALKGKFDLHQILQEYVSQQLDRVIVGEVAGKEILALFKALQMAKGSMSTVHATSAKGAVDRLTTLAMEEPGVDETYAIRQVAAHVNLIVQMTTHWSRNDAGHLVSRRYISEVAWVEPGENSRPAISTVYVRPNPLEDGRWGSLAPRLRDQVIAFGFPAANLPVFDLPEE